MEPRSESTRYLRTPQNAGEDRTQAVALFSPVSEMLQSASSVPRTFSKARTISFSSRSVRHDGIGIKMLRSKRWSATGQVPLA